MRKPQMRPAWRWSTIALLVLIAACGPGELATPTGTEAEAIVRGVFPDATVRVREVTREENALRVPAEFNGADVIFVMSAGPEAWQVASVEQGGNSYTVEQLGEIVQTMEIMRGLSDALETFHAARGDYPMLDDLTGLGELVPEFYGADAPMQDAWGNALRYRHQGEDYTLTSSGPDGDPGSRDDVLLITGTFVTAE